MSLSFVIQYWYNAQFCLLDWWLENCMNNPSQVEAYSEAIKVLSLVVNTLNKTKLLGPCEMFHSV